MDQFFEKKEQGGEALLGKLCRPYLPELLDLSLMNGLTLLERARAPPETWTTRLCPCRPPELRVVADLFLFVINFSTAVQN